MRRCSGFFFGLLDCWSSEGLFNLEPREDRLFWVKTSFNQTCFRLFISRLSWRRRKGELKISTSTSDCQNAQWNCWKGEPDTVVYTYGSTCRRRHPNPSAWASGAAIAPGPSAFFILHHSPSLMLLWDLQEAGSPARGSQPAITHVSVSGQKTGRRSRRWQRYDNAAAAQTWPFTITGQRSLKTPNKGAMNGENCRKRSFFACFEPGLMQALEKKPEFIASRNQSDYWQRQSVQTPRGPPHTAMNMHCYQDCCFPTFITFACPFMTSEVWTELLLTCCDHWSSAHETDWLSVLSSSDSDGPSSENLSADPELPTAVNAIWRQFLGHTAYFKRAFTTSSRWETNVSGIGRWWARLTSEGSVLSTQQRVLQLCFSFKVHDQSLQILKSGLCVPCIKENHNAS